MDSYRGKPIRYYLNKEKTPTIPVPGDCEVSKICLEEESLIFKFEDNITLHDSIERVCPDSKAKSLVIKFHLLDGIDGISLFISQNSTTYKGYELPEMQDILLDLPRHGLTYLHHNVGYCNIIVRLWSGRNIVLDLYADYVELDWV